MAVGEARLVDVGSGLVPEGEGWFVVNLADAGWFRNPALGHSALFLPDERSPELGVNVGVLEPGRPNCLYHAESVQEAFLVLAGECVLVVEGEERRLRAWDYVHCPAGTRHVFVGAGDSRCAVLCIGARRPDRGALFPVDEAAARHGASVAHETTSPPEAYSGFPAFEPERLDHAGLPWEPRRG
ncbi:MAG: cupin domain-containing protein [Gaiellaceae bacterium]